ncbi:MAG: Ig domain-containing protein [Terriglobales bacterium]
MAALLGDTRVESQVDSNTSGQAEAFPVNATAAGSVASLAIYLDRSSTAQQLMVGLYADTGGHPGTRLTQGSTAQPLPGAWNMIAMPAANVVKGTRYWIAILSSGSGTVEFRDTNKGNCSSETSAQTTLSSLPVSWTTGARWATCRVSAYGSGLSAPVSVAVAVLPSSSSLPLGKSQQFSANVSGTSNTAVSWKASGGNISSGGMYTAPMSTGSFVVTATSMADTSKSASAPVSVTAAATVAVTISPGSASLSSGGSQQFTAAVSGSSNAAVTWSATGGSVSTSGLYTAPSAAGTYTVTATSAADTTKSASATVTVSAAPVVAVSITPGSASLITGGTQQFTASVSGSSNTAVTWSATGGSITSGLYTAPSAAGTYTVKATSVADSTKSASATVTVSAAPVVAVTISPVSASMLSSGTQQFTASVSGSSNTGVSWSATAGSVSSGGMYTAPAAAGSYTVKATSAADSTKSASATVTVSAPVVAVSLSPGSASLSTSATQQFTATVTGSSNTAVSWSATGGAISTGGLYTAPSAAGTFTVKATSVADSTKSASATVTVSVPVQHSATLSWSPESAVVGYNVYRGSATGGPYTMINTSLNAPANYADFNVQAGQTFFYVVTSVDSGGVESLFSSQVQALIP